MVLEGECTKRVTDEKRSLRLQTLTVNHFLFFFGREGVQLILLGYIILRTDKLTAISYSKSY